MDIIHPCGLWMYRGMREMIVECWCVNLRKVWSHAVLVCIVHEKSTKLQESMKMMGLYEISYWLSYFLYDGIMLGGSLSFLAGLLSLGDVFDGNVFNVFFKI